MKEYIVGMQYKIRLPNNRWTFAVLMKADFLSHNPYGIFRINEEEIWKIYLNEDNVA